MKRAVICLGAGPEQVPVIKKAVELGFRVIAIDQNPEAPGLPRAQVTIINSTWDVAGNISCLSEINDCVFAGILNRSSGPPTITAAWLSAVFDIPGVPPISAATIVAKALFDFQAKWVFTGMPKVVFEKDKDIRFPVVVRPSTSIRGKAGVSVVNNYAELQSALSLAQEHSLDQSAIINEWIDGEDISLMTYVRDGKLIPFAVIQEENHVDSNGRISGKAVSVPAKCQSGTPEHAHMVDIAHHLVAFFGLNTTPLNISFRYPEGGDPWLIEAHLDMGGDSIMDRLLPQSNPDIDVFGFAINALVGKVPDTSIEWQPARIEL